MLSNFHVWGHRPRPTIFRPFTFFERCCSGPRLHCLNQVTQRDLNMDNDAGCARGRIVSPPPPPPPQVVKCGYGTHRSTQGRFGRSSQHQHHLHVAGSHKKRDGNVFRPMYCHFNNSTVLRTFLARLFMVKLLRTVL